MVVMQRIDMSGQRYGRLVAIKPAHYVARRLHWEFQCDCGTAVILIGGDVRSGNTQSCGCLRVETTVKRFKRHGMADSPEHQTWQQIRRRCHDPENKAFQNYGGRGIAVCARWRASFENFFADMGLRPSALHSIERIDNNRGYEPSNCKWATKREQGNNTRRNTFLEFNGKRQTIAQWAREIGIPTAALQQRISRLKMSPEEALTRPLRKLPRRKPAHAPAR